MDGPTCAFGCGRPAVATLKNGKPVCGPSHRSCPVLRKRIGASKRGKNPFANRPHPRGMAGKTPWNKGRRIDDLYIPEAAQRIREAGRRGAARAWEVFRSSPELEARRRQKISETARRVGMGGYRHGSGRGKKGWYKGYWCDSSYELAFVVYSLDHGMPFSRNWRAFPYVFEGIPRRWMPDFVLPDGTFVEIKGYLTPQAEAKFAAFPHPLVILRKHDLRPMLEYVVGIYGKDFIRLYE